MLRDVIITDTDEEAMELWRHSAAFAGGAWFAPFGFAEALRPPGGEIMTPEQQLEHGLLFAGTLDSVKRQVQAMMDVTPVSWIFMYQYNGLLTRGQILRSMEEFSEKVLPEFGVVGA